MTRRDFGMGVEVLDLAPRGPFDFNLEAEIFPDQPELTPSPEEFARLVLESVRKRSLQERVIIQSFDFRILHAMRVLDPAVRRAALYNGPARDFVALPGSTRPTRRPSRWESTTRRGALRRART